MGVALQLYYTEATTKNVKSRTCREGKRGTIPSRAACYSRLAYRGCPVIESLISMEVRSGYTNLMTGSASTNRRYQKSNHFFVTMVMDPIYVCPSYATGNRPMKDCGKCLGLRTCIKTHHTDPFPILLSTHLVLFYPEV